MVTVGQLNQIGVMQTNTPTTSQTGGKVDSFTDTLTTRGKLRLKTSRMRADGRVEIQNEWEWVTRYQSGMESKNTRWIINGKTLTVIGIDLDYKNEFIKITLANG